MLLLYNIALIIGAVVLIPYYLIQMWRTGKYRRSLRQRLGSYHPNRDIGERSGPLIWVHGCSVGETMAGLPLIEELKKSVPTARILSSVVTDTGYSVAVRENLADQVVYLPLDFSFSVRRALDGFAPDLLVIMETEIWPNFFWMAARRGILLVIANGRISNKSFPTYRRYRWFFKHVLSHVNVLCMQSDDEAERIISIGAPSERVVVTGNTKYDQVERVVIRTESETLLDELQLQEGVPVFVAGSTHDDEEKQVVATYRKLLERFPDLVLILAPRHPERTGGVLEAMRNDSLEPVVLSRLRARDTAGEAHDAVCPRTVLVDTVGDLAALYSLATVVFVGGSLVPVGGHNILEPAAFGKPVLYGPHMFNFREENALLTHSGGISVKDNNELYHRLYELLDNRELLDKIGLRGRQTIEDKMGSSRSVVAVMQDRGILDFTRVDG